MSSFRGIGTAEAVPFHEIPSRTFRQSFHEPLYQAVCFCDFRENNPQQNLGAME